MNITYRVIITCMHYVFLPYTMREKCLIINTIGITIDFNLFWSTANAIVNISRLDIIVRLQINSHPGAPWVLSKLRLIRGNLDGWQS